MPLVFQASAQELCQQLAQQIADCAKTENPLRVVGFTGPPGAGKSFVVDLLARLLAGQTAGASPLLAGLLPMDGFHKSNAVLATESLSDAKGTPPSFDVVGYVMALHRAQDASTVLYAPGYDRDLGEAIAAAHRIECGGTVLTEGNYLASQDGPWAMAREAIDLLIYLDVPAETTRERLMERHTKGGKRDAAAAAQWIQSVDDPNRLIIEGTKHRCDQIWVLELEA